MSNITAVQTGSGWDVDGPTEEPVHVDTVTKQFTSTAALAAVRGAVGNADASVLCVGGDHPYSQWYGSNGTDGVAALNAAYGVRSYIAINTASQDEQSASNLKFDPVGGVRRLTWAQLRELQAQGVEVASHGHRHVTSWERINTGVRIRYLGAAASATVNVDNANVTLVGGGGSENATLSRTTYSTLAAMVAAINATPNWSAVLAPELTGDEPGSVLARLNAARNVKASTANEYFCCGGGIVIEYQPGSGSNWKTTRCVVRRLGSPSGLKIMIGGVVKVNIDFAVTTTTAGVVSVINSAGVFGLRAFLSDNNVSSVNRENYMLGDEQSASLFSGGGSGFTATAGKQRAIIPIGLGQRYMVARQLQKSAFVMRENGIVAEQFAQSGSDINPITLGALSEFRGARIDPNHLSPIYPNAMPLATLAKSDWYPHFAALYANYPTADSLKCVVRAMVDSGPWYVNVLCHALLADGSSGYSIQNTDPTPYYDQTESNWLGFLQYVKTQIDAGALIPATQSEAQQRFGSARAPGNLFFNPRFQNRGALDVSASSTGSMGTVVPGWQWVSDSAYFSAVGSADDGRGDGAGKLQWVGKNTGESLMLAAVVPLEPGVYEVSILVEHRPDFVGGGYTYLHVRPNWSAIDGTRSGNGSIQTSRASFAGIHTLTTRITVEAPTREFPAVFGNSGPFDLSANNQLAIQIDGKAATGSFSVAGATPSATTVGEVAAAINTALSSSSVYGYEYRNCASVEQGSLVVRSPEYYVTNNSPGLVITGTARDTLFGGEVLALPDGVGNAETLVPYEFRLIGSFGGTVNVSQPMLRKVVAL